MKTDTAIVNI